MRYHIQYLLRTDLSQEYVQNVYSFRFPPRMMKDKRYTAD